MTKPNAVDVLEESFEKVEKIEAELAPAEKELETRRWRVWRLLGAPALGSVSFGGFIFSRGVLLVGGVFAGLFFGTVFAAPAVGMIVAAAVAVTGVYWLLHRR